LFFPLIFRFVFILYPFLFLLFHFYPPDLFFLYLFFLFSPFLLSSFIHPSIHRSFFYFSLFIFFFLYLYLFASSYPLSIPFSFIIIFFISFHFISFHLISFHLISSHFFLLLCSNLSYDRPGIKLSDKMTPRGIFFLTGRVYFFRKEADQR